MCLLGSGKSSASKYHTGSEKSNLVNEEKYSVHPNTTSFNAHDLLEVNALIANAHLQHETHSLKGTFLVFILQFTCPRYPAPCSAMGCAAHCKLLIALAGS